MACTLEQLNAASLDDAVHLLDGVYEHSPWIARQALAARPFVSLAQLKHALAQVLRQAGRDAQTRLICAHPELAGKAMMAQTLTAESTAEQTRAGLTACSPGEYAQIQQLNTAYNARFGWPFILAVRGPRGTGLSRRQIIDSFARRLHAHPDDEHAECLRQIHRIAELRLADKFGTPPTLGQAVWDWHAQLACHSERDDALTVTYLSEAHRACAQALVQHMRECGLDEVHIDAVGNVVGRYHPAQSGQPWLLTGSHYDTVRNAGRYDGRLGIFVPLAAVRELHRQGRRLPLGVEVVAFAEEEGQRYPAAFLGSSALTGQFNPAWLNQRDAQGITLGEAMRLAGLRADGIAALRRDATHYLGFVEVHIEQGPVLAALDLPLGVVTSINASTRLLGEITGLASHAGTTPMSQRRDAACAAAELALYLEQRATQGLDTVATMGLLQVPQGSINVVPGRCSFSLDLRAPGNAERDALVADVRAAAQQLCERRGVSLQLEETLSVSAAPSAPAWQQRWERAVQALGLPVHRMVSGAGHDAMMLHALMPQAMLFVRGENGGISHNPLESSTADDMQLAVDAFTHLLNQLATP